MNNIIKKFIIKYILLKQMMYYYKLCLRKRRVKSLLTFKFIILFNSSDINRTNNIYAQTISYMGGSSQYQSSVIS